MSTYLASRDPDDEQHRHRELAQPRPVVGLRALPQRRELVRQTVDGVRGAAILDPGRIARERREQRLREPALEERVDAVALDLVRQRLVTRASGGALGVVGDAGRRADEHEVVDELGPVERELEAEPAAHGVPDVGRAPALVAQRVRGRHEVEIVGNPQRASRRRAGSPTTTRSLCVNPCTERVRHPRILP